MTTTYFIGVFTSFYFGLGLFWWALFSLHYWLRGDYDILLEIFSEEFTGRAERPRMQQLVILFLGIVAAWPTILFWRTSN